MAANSWFAPAAMPCISSIWSDENAAMPGTMDSTIPRVPDQSNPIPRSRPA